MQETYREIKRAVQVYYTASIPKLNRNRHICTCYGAVDLFSDHDKHSTETITSQHHDAPRYILSNEPSGRNIREALFINHTDLELQVIKALDGRTPPFTVDDGGYSARGAQTTNRKIFDVVVYFTCCQLTQSE